MAGKRVLIVKFGGSSIASADLGRWVAAIERARDPLVIVPGGGPFAKAVRQYQSRMGYGAGAAHRMALLGMEQFGHALVSLGTRLRPASTLDEIRQMQNEGLVPVWMPTAMALGAAEIVEGWDTNSDTLAAWLAAQVPGASLCLIKQIDVPPNTGIQSVVAAGMVPPAFEDVLGCETEVHIAGPSDLAVAGKRLSEGGIPGRALQRARFVEAAQ